MASLNDLPRQLGTLVLRGVMLIAGLVFALALFVAGALLVGGVLLWSLLRGRRPAVPAQWQMFRAAARQPFRAAGMRAGADPARRPGRGHDDEVVDVEARELPPASLPPQR